MKKLLTTLLLVTYGICNGQNLVPNPSFEQYSICPDWITQIDRATPWFTPTLGSPDYFNTCTTTSLVAIPSNAFGYQYPHTGDAYVGIGVRNFYTEPFVGMIISEYLEVRLDTTLDVGRKYYFSLYLSNADSMDYASDELGIYLSNTPVTNFSVYALGIIPQFENPIGNFLIDRIGWNQICGSYTAVGGERYLTIGNFQTHPSSNTIPMTGGAQTNNSDGAYYYIDDIYLSADSIPFNYYYSNVGVQETDANKSVAIYPNPFNYELNVKVNNFEQTEIILYDFSSRILLQQTFTNTTSINTEQLTRGLYLYTVRNRNGIIKNGKIIKE